MLLGRRQVVRHRVLDPAFAGSNPSAPAIFESKATGNLKHHKVARLYLFLQFFRANERYGQYKNLFGKRESETG